MNAPRWKQCVNHHGQDVAAFVSDYFSSQRNCLVIAGAGFDPRATHVTELLVNTLGRNATGLFIREDRPNPDAETDLRAESNASNMSRLISNHETVRINIFDKDDGAPLGGRVVVNKLKDRELESYSDIIIDMSAMSIGVSFPIVRFILDYKCRKRSKLNLHLMATADPSLDGLIRPLPGDTANPIHGFKGNMGIIGGRPPIKLWLPQLTLKRRFELQKIYMRIGPHDTCPILPFPSRDPKASDKLCESFINELESEWEVDTRNILYADERRPLDLYRTILRIDDLRKPVFKDIGGSQLILSPLGSRMLAIGALMAALDRYLAVYYVESIGYEIDWKLVDETSKGTPDWAHVWLAGEAYPQT